MQLKRHQDAAKQKEKDEYKYLVNRHHYTHGVASPTPSSSSPDGTRPPPKKPDEAQLWLNMVAKTAELEDGGVKLFKLSHAHARTLPHPHTHTHARACAHTRTSLLN